jgi:hypothetical protein
MSDTPEHALWAAVLRQGFDDALSNDLSAQHWLFSERTSIGSFNWICDIFDLDPEETRARGILSLGIARGSAQKPEWVISKEGDWADGRSSR